MCDNVPYKLLIDDIIPMRKDISKSYNATGIGNLFKNNDIDTFYHDVALRR